MSTQLPNSAKVYSDKRKIFFIGAVENADGNILYWKFGGGLKEGDYHIVNKDTFNAYVKNLGYTSTGDTVPTPKLYENKELYPDISQEQAEGLLPAASEQVSDKVVNKVVKEEEKKEKDLRKPLVKNSKD